MQHRPPPLPCTVLLQGSVPEHGHSAALLGQHITLTPWCLLQASRHFQLEAPFLGAIFGSHGAGSCWLMNTAEIKCYHLILVIWGLWSAALIPVRTLDSECPAPGCRTHQQPSPPRYHSGESRGCHPHDKKKWYLKHKFREEKLETKHGIFPLYSQKLFQML